MILKIGRSNPKKRENLLFHVRFNAMESHSKAQSNDVKYFVKHEHIDQNIKHIL